MSSFSNNGEPDIRVLNICQPSPETGHVVYQGSIPVENLQDEEWETEDEEGEEEEDEGEEEDNDEDDDDEEAYDGPPVYDSPFFHLAEHMAIPYLKQCSQCYRPGKNLCTGCKSVYYCSKDCQVNHWKTHKTNCKNLKAALTRFQTEEEALHHCDDNWTGTPTDYLDPAQGMLGNFWGLHETRPYCRALGNIVNVYSAELSKQALYESILAVMKLLYVNRSDNMGFRDMATALLMRVDQDQLAFDFIRWYGLYADDQYDWGNPRLPYLSYWKCDRSEDILAQSGCHLSLAHVAIYGLIKVRLYLHLVNIDAMYAVLAFLHGNHARESSSPLAKLDGQMGVLRMIKDYVVGAPGKGFGDFKKRDKKEILAQIDRTIQKGEKLNKRIWKALVNPKPLLSQQSPGSYSMGSTEECYFAVSSCFPAWMEHTDCLVFLADYVKAHGGSKYDSKMSRY